MDESYRFIEKAEELTPLMEEVARQETVALDTEADSMHHYHEKLCLIQFGTGQRQWIVDPLAGLDLVPLMRLLEQRELIFHGADYDLRLLYRTFHFRPTRIFDTMIAAQILGRPRIGLAALVEEMCGVTLPKEGQKADWSRRPLPEDLLHYASGDTRFLSRLAEALQGELTHKNRLAWHGEACHRLLGSTRETRVVNSDEAWRVKGGKLLTGRPAAILRELWRWREECARASDRPPFKIANNEFLLQWVQWISENPQASFEEAPPRPVWLRGSRLRAFERALSRALALPESEWPGPPAGKGGIRSSRQEEALLKRLVEARDRLAGELGLDPGVLGARETLRLLVRQAPQTVQEFRQKSTLMAWQTEALAEILVPLLQSPAPPESAQMAD